MKVLLQAAVCAVSLASFALSDAWAGDMKLLIHDGRVTLEARDVTVRQILAEWARVGQTNIVNGDKVQGGTVTLQLVNVPERQALDILLRSVGGYMAAPRSVAAPATSSYDRILVLAKTTPLATRTSSAPSAPPTTRPAFSTQSAPKDPTMEDDVDQVNQMNQGMGSPVNVNPQDMQQQVRPYPGPQPGPGQPLNPAQNLTPLTTPQKPVNPLGVPVGTSPVPGVIIQPAEPAQQKPPFPQPVTF